MGRIGFFFFLDYHEYWFHKRKAAMTSKIHILSDQTINQVAAGEVIENPASVVKELIENAIDAGATQISIEVLSGGFQGIKISDNGSGMSPDDAVLSLQRHTTSKIVTVDDLFALMTMGFRGEALASIAAISKMTLLTAIENAPAVFIETEGGKIDHIAPGARTRGTTIEVRSLFYNVPARKKFQKSSAASSAEITKTVTQLALAHPEIGFELVQQRHSQFSLPASNSEPFSLILKERALVLLGEEFLNSTHVLEMNEGNYKATGLIGDPLFSRHNRSGQYLFINRRPVFCPLISFAVRDAYGTRLSTERHPVYLLHLSIPSELLDVNVHPQKKEIRLREEDRVKYALHSAVNHTLFFSESLEQNARMQSRPFSGRLTELSVLSGVVERPTLAEEESPSFQGGILQTEEVSFSSMDSTRPDFSVPLVFKEEMSESSHQEFSLEIGINVIGLYQHYFLVEATSLPCPFSFDAPGIVWIDLCAAESRVQFESMMCTMRASARLSQGLLIPLTLSCSRAEAHLLSGHLETIQKLGIQIREIGQTVFLIEAIPPFLEEEEVAIVLEEMISELQGMERETSLTEDRSRRLAGCICRRIRGRKKSYTVTEATHLIKELLQAEDPFHCPHGKKTLFYVGEEELESYFTRKAALSHAIEAFAERSEKGKT
jgi:DNA mismatch repair protein MutL